MYHDLQISRLRALITVCDAGGFRRAAEELNVTQPAVSQQIQQLNRLVKGPVFLSTRGGLKLSPRGEELLGYARRLVALNDETVQRFAPPPAGTLRFTIGVSDQLAEALPAILGRLAEALPGAQICARTGPSEVLEHEIATGQLDLAVVLDSAGGRRGGAWLELGRIEMDWFGCPQPQTGDDMPVTLFTEPCTLRGRMIEALEASHVPWRIAYEGAELAGVRAAVKAGLGIGCLIANGDELWGLSRSTDLALPRPPEPVAVSLALAPDRTTTRVASLTREAVDLALLDYPIAA